MQSQLGYLPHDRDTLASGIQTPLTGSVVYAAPTGFNLISDVATATAVTLTPRQVLGGLINQDPAGGAVTTTTPTAALLVAAFKGVQVNSSVRFIIRNTASAAQTITVAGGTGVGVYALSVLTIAENQAAEYMIVFTNVSPGNEAATLVTLNSAMVAST